MGKKKDSSARLGRSILRTKKHGSVKSGKGPGGGDTWLHTSELNDGYDWNRLNLNSVTEQSALDEFLTTAELARTEFTAEKLNIKVIDPSQFTGLPSVEESKAIHDAQQLNKDLLNIPRRPKWDADTTPEELAQSERDSFLEWRRQLSLLQEKEHLVITPFERNLEFWRQLWRVIERSDIIVQIVDARDPLLFRCEDLEKYVKEMNSAKENMILISKADLLTRTQRRIWADYFSQQGIKVVFWSAVEEQERLKRLEKLEEEEECEEEEEEEESDEEVDGDDEKEDSEEEIEVYNPTAVLEDEVAADNKTSDDLISQTEQLAISTTTSQDSSSGANGPQEGSSALDDVAGHLANDAQDGQGKDESIESDEDDCDTDVVESKSSNTEAAKSQSNSLSNCERTHSEDQAVNNDGPVCTDGNDTHNAPVELNRGRNNTHGGIQNDSALLTGEQLMELLYAMHAGKESVQDGVTTVGMVGYPNVGKSSTINALLQQKKVPVSATPGRTKHFQTLFVEPTMCLCDCPGLVMPSFVSTKAEMVINGILPIDQMRDYMPPVSLICQRIPRKVLETLYGINIVKPKEGEDQKRPPTNMEFINAYAYMRGYMTHKGLPDGPRAARIVLKDYVKGKLLYCHGPPDTDIDVFKPVQQAVESKPYVEGEDRKYASRPLITAEGTMVRHDAHKRLDEAFFNDQYEKTHSKGVEEVKGFKDCYTQHSLDLNSRVNMTGTDKPWKKHGNKNKKEKIRRLYRHLDEC